MPGSTLGMTLACQFFKVLALPSPSFFIESSYFALSSTNCLKISGISKITISNATGKTVRFYGVLSVINI